MGDWIDCSQPTAPGMPQPPRAPEFELRTLREVRVHRMNMQQIVMLTHHGTHVDAPLHFVADGASIEGVALERLIGDGVVLDLARPALTAIGPEDLARAEPRVELGDIVLLRTGWSTRYGDSSYSHSPYLTGPAAEWLIEREIAALGIDTISPDEPPHAMRAPDFQYPVHRLLLGADIPIIENLRLEKAHGIRCDVVALPIALAGGDGGPARVVVRRRVALF